MGRKNEAFYGLMEFIQSVCVSAWHNCLKSFKPTVGVLWGPTPRVLGRQIPPPPLSCQRYRPQEPMGALGLARPSRCR